MNAIISYFCQSKKRCTNKIGTENDEVLVFPELDINQA